MIIIDSMTYITVKYILAGDIKGYILWLWFEHVLCSLTEYIFEMMKIIIPFKLVRNVDMN